MQHRREFIKKTALLLPGLCLQLPKTAVAKGTENDLKDAFPSLPDLHQLFPDPVILKSVEVFSFDQELLLVVRNDHGMQGITLCNQRMPALLSILKELVIPFFKGKDVRNICRLVDEVYTVNSNYKYAGMPFWNCVGHVEIAIWDMLGRMLQKPLNEMVTVPRNKEIDIYLSSTDRSTTPEAESELFVKRIGETGAKAIKFKIGGRMSRNADASEGRSENLMKLLRKKLPADITFYADANGSYDVENGVRMAAVCEQYQVDIMEEPVPFDEYENLQEVKKRVNTIRLAGGEQDTSLYRFEWLAGNNVLDVLQPDLYYNGGFVRCFRVAETAFHNGKWMAPHSPKTDPLAAVMMHLVSVIPNAAPFQEWHISLPEKKSWYSPNFEIRNGKVNIPEHDGLGIAFDDAIWQKATLVTPCSPR
jgi:L-alanine-DL-glutamate epimerase-like enolase superfamily enzyme